MDLSRFAPKRWPRMSAGAAVTLLIGLLYTVSYWAYRGWRVGSDGHYSWIFARSIAFDGDLHFANDYAACGDPFNAGHDEGAGRPANPFYFGPGLLWSIPLRVARALVHLPADATASARAGCEGPYVDWGLCLAPLCGALTLWLGYKVARRYASDAAAACAVAVVGLCSPLAHYAALITSYSHVWAALGCAVALYGYARAIENEASRLRWFVCGLAVGFGALMRIQGGAMLLLPGLWLLRDLVVRARARQLREAGEVIARGLITLAGFALVFSLQLWVY